MYKFIGATPSIGTFVTPEGREVEYDNRIIRFATDESISDVIGFDIAEEKIKMVYLAKCFGCVPTDEAVDNVLKGIKPLSNVQLVFSSVNGGVSVTGFKVV